MSETNEMIKHEQNTGVTVSDNTPMGFEDEDQKDFIIPRVKVINLLSPEAREKIAEEGDVINSLTKEKLNGKIFIPVYKFTNIILWKDRALGGGIAAISHDGKIAIPTDGGAPYPCAHLAEFDNTKTGKDAQPTHVKYMNFFGFFAGERMPIILSFSKTSFAEGKRLYSLAKVTMQNMWHNGYRLDAKLMKKAGNEWYNPVVFPTGAVSDEDKAFGLMLFQQFRNKQVIDYDRTESDSESSSSGPSMTAEQANSTEF